MELALRNSLNAIFAKHENAGRTDRDGASLDDKIARRLTAFRTMRDTRFRPAMDAVGSYLAAKGYEHEVLIFDSARTAPAREQESRIQFHVIKPPRRGEVRDHPGLSVVCDPFSNTVRFRMNERWSGGGAGFAPIGAMTIEEADLAAFQDQMVTFLGATFR